MANTIKIKNSGISNNAPTSLEFGELGLNYADGKIFFKNLSNTIVEFSTPPNFVVQSTAPANTSVIWADTSVTGVGVVPVGGTTGQVLSKGSNTSYDAVWANAITSSDLALKANIASPTFTGTVTIPAGASISGFAPLANAALTGVPTAPTATAATNTTQIATTAFVRTEVANLVASAPAALDTLDELAAALGDDANFATTTATAIGLKAPLANAALTGTPTAPTATAGTNTTQLATTAFVQTAKAYSVVTSSTRPASPFTGQQIYETDTNNVLVYNGSAWVCITPKSDYASNQPTSTSTSFVTLASDPQVSIQTGTRALVTISARHVLLGAGGYCMTGYVISGASSIAATDGRSIQNYFGSGDLGNDRHGAFTYMETGLTAGINTFRIQHRVTAGTIYATQRSITVVGIP